jgi:hypothetical protein
VHAIFRQDPIGRRQRQSIGKQARTTPDDPICGRRPGQADPRLNLALRD